MVFLFVYGTLKAGYCRHHHLAGTAFRGHARTSPGYALYDCGEFPAMVAEGDGCVTGELYEVPESLLDQVLDEVEWRPEMYDRAEVQCATGDGRTLTCTTYLYQPPVDLLRRIGDTWPG